MNVMSCEKEVGMSVEEAWMIVAKYLYTSRANYILPPEFYEAQSVLVEDVRAKREG